MLNEGECKTEDGRRSGVCMNVYDCHRNGGTSRGQCALGFGACCVCKCFAQKSVDGVAELATVQQIFTGIKFLVTVTASCDQEVKNNITYIVSPNFPALMPADIKTCKLKVKMMSPDISQLRFDFVHFSMVSKCFIFGLMYFDDDFAIHFQGQPNRRTGDCDGDIFSLLGGFSEFKFCGQNNGQHSKFTVQNRHDTEWNRIDA